jgi:hypothetical protein
MSRRTVQSLLARPVRLVVALVIAPAAVAALSLGWLALPAGAEEEIVIRPETVISGAPGATVAVATMPVPAELVGRACDLRLTTRNQSSVHPGTNVIVATGASNTLVEGAEDSPDGSVLVTQRVELGTEIVVEVQLGSEGLSSLGFTVGFECSPDSLLPVVQPARQTATTTTTTPSTTTPPTTVSPTTIPPTTAAPVVLPARQQTPLPQTAPAQPIAAIPSYTG